MKNEIFNTFYGKDEVGVYHKFQEIEKSIEDSDYLYQYFDDIKNMLISDKSYIRVRGFKILCQLSKYDSEDKIIDIFNILMSIFDDEKPTALRQALMALPTLLINKPELIKKVKIKLKNIDYSKYKNTMQPLIKKDIDFIFKKFND